MATATSTPPGFGHVFAGAHYVDAWMAILDLPGWSAERLDRLKEKLLVFDTQAHES